jgi:hypothetical protein
MNLLKEYQELLDFGIDTSNKSGTYEGVNFSFDFKVEDNRVYILHLFDDELKSPLTEVEIDLLESSLSEFQDDGESLEDFENRTHYTL